MITTALKITAIISMIVVIGMSIMTSIHTVHTTPVISGVCMAIALIVAFAIGLIIKE